MHLLDTGGPVTAERLRGVTLAGFERMLNVAAVREALTAALDRPASLDAEAAAAAFQPVTRAIESAPIVIREQGEPLRAPGSRGYPDDFYRRVAASYNRASRRPVVAVATEAGVPRTTAARWVKEARRRGLLDAASGPGKA